MADARGEAYTEIVGAGKANVPAIEGHAGAWVRADRLVGRRGSAGQPRRRQGMAPQIVVAYAIIVVPVNKGTLRVTTNRGHELRPIGPRCSCICCRA